MLRKTKRAPSPPGPGFSQTLWLLGEGLRRGPGAVIRSIQSQYGDIARFRLGQSEAILLSAPALIHQALVEDREVFAKGGGKPWQKLTRIIGYSLFTLPDGAIWKQRRIASQPFFTKRAVSDYVGVVSSAVDRLTEEWSGRAELDLGREMIRLTMDVVCQAAMGLDLEKEPGLAKAAAEAISDGIELISSGFTELLSFPESFPTPSNLRARRVVRSLDEIIYKIIERRRVAPASRRDYLDALLEMRDQESGLALDGRAIRDELVTMFVAGHETTASLFTWLWYTLSTRPDIEARIQQEVDELLGDRAPTNEDLRRLPFLAAVVHETLRMYPPIWIFVREATRAHQLGGYEISKGSLIIVAPWFVHHDARYFPEPERFLPERFLGTESKLADRSAFLPFGAGPRTCIGNAFALMETMTVVARLVQRWRFIRLDSKPAEPNFDTTLRPLLPIRARLVPRALH